MSATPVLEVAGVHTRFGRNLIHEDISFTLGRGEVLAVVGGSGSGKTTLLREMVGLLPPTRGDVRLFGTSIWHGEAQAVKAVKRRFGMLFQHGALFSALNVYDNIAFPLRELKELPEDLIHDLVMLKLAMVELEPHHGALLPAEISGGMTKRVALARALALEPELLFLDEPTAGLDPDRSEAFVRLIQLLNELLGLTVVLVTHDLDTLAALATRVAVLADRRLVAIGPLAEVTGVAHPFIENFFHSERSARAMRRVAARQD